MKNLEQEIKAYQEYKLTIARCEKEIEKLKVVFTDATKDGSVTAGKFLLSNIQYTRESLTSLEELRRRVDNRILKGLIKTTIVNRIDIKNV